MLQAFVLSFKTGIGNNQTWGGLSNYARLLKDGVFRTAITNNFFYLIIQVPVMLILAIFLACLLNKKELRGKGIYRTMISYRAVQHWYLIRSFLKHYLPMMVISTRFY